MTVVIQNVIQLSFCVCGAVVGIWLIRWANRQEAGVLDEARRQLDQSCARLNELESRVEMKNE